MNFVVEPIISMLDRFSDLTEACREIVVIEGMPASGKTHLLNSARRWAKTSEKLFISEPKKSAPTIDADYEDDRCAYWDMAKIWDEQTRNVFKPLRYMYTHLDDTFCQEIVASFCS